MGRISVELSDELEKKLRITTIERFGGRKGDLSRAIEEAVKTWVAKENWINEPKLNTS
jgi:metal-responsive CopG/Arc/MetJ family transcriptional regulator